MISSLKKSNLFRSWNAFSESERIIFICAMFSMALLFFRIGYTGQLSFLFLVWNLFLALIPYAISSRLRNMSANRVLFYITFGTWLLFLPNSFYILTDLFHLDPRNSVPLWFDLALLLSFAWTGLLLGLVSLKQVEKCFHQLSEVQKNVLFLFPVMFLNAMGIYMGRFLRFNSWDVIADPTGIFHELLQLFIHPFQSRMDWGMILCYSVLLTLIYLAVQKLGRVL